MKTDTLNQELLHDELQLNDLVEYFIVLKSQWRIILITSLIFAFVSSIYFFRLPDIYGAKVSILVEKVDRGINRSLQDMVLPSLGAEDEYFGTQIEILTSRTLMQQVMSEIDFPDNVGLSVKSKKSLTGIIKSMFSSNSNYQANIKHLRLSRIMNVSVQGHDPVLAATIANKFAQVYVRQNVQENLFVSQQMFRWLDDDVGEAEGDSGYYLDQSIKVEFINTLESVANDPIIKTLRSDRLETLSQLRDLRQRYKAKHPIIRELNESLIKVESELKERTLKIVDTLKANLNGELNIANIRILDPATIPEGPSGPNRLAGILFCAVFGIISGIILVSLAEYANQKIRTEQDLPLNINAPVLGSIPLLKVLRSTSKEADPSYEKPLLEDLLREDSVLNDAVVQVRTNVLFSMPGESKKMMLMSTIPSEGKSTVAILLALSLAVLGKKVLLIDADLRKPTLRKYLDMKGNEGLSDYLQESASLEGVIQQVPGRTLDVILGGKEVHNPTELLSSVRFDELCKKLEQDYDHILFDIPPVLHIPDGLLIAKNVSCGVLVCGSRIVQKREFKRVVEMAKEKFDPMKLKLLGIVINQVDYDRDEHHRGYKYYQGYTNKNKR